MPDRSLQRLTAHRTTELDHEAGQGTVRSKQGFLDIQAVIWRLATYRKSEVIRNGLLCVNSGGMVEHFSLVLR
jgi:hypothetical protein